MSQDKKYEVGLYTPFGPSIGYYKMAASVIDGLNSQIDEDLQDFSAKLVGKISSELAFNDECKK